MGEYFHVIGYFKPDTEEAKVLFSDLNKTDLEKRFLRSYRRGERILLPDGRLATLEDLVQVKIIRTDKPSEAALADLQAEHRKSVDRINASSSWVYFVSPGYGAPEDIVHTGSEVTSEFISGPPGNRNWLVNLVSNNWTITVVGGIVVVLFGLLLA